jgi:hypothetical protein
MAKPFTRAQALAVELDSPRVATREEHVGGERVLAPVSGELHARCVRIEPDHRAVSSGARGESLRPYVQRFEQVRLAGAIGAVEKHDARHEGQLE